MSIIEQKPTILTSMSYEILAQLPEERLKTVLTDIETNLPDFLKDASPEQIALMGDSVKAVNIGDQKNGKTFLMQIVDAVKKDEYELGSVGVELLSELWFDSMTREIVDTSVPERNHELRYFFDRIKEKKSRDFIYKWRVAGVEAYDVAEDSNKGVGQVPSKQLKELIKYGAYNFYDNPNADPVAAHRQINEIVRTYFVGGSLHEPREIKRLIDTALPSHITIEASELQILRHKHQEALREQQLAENR